MAFADDVRSTCLIAGADQKLRREIDKRQPALSPSVNCPAPPSSILDILEPAHPHAHTPLAAVRARHHRSRARPRASSAVEDPERVQKRFSGVAATRRPV